MDRRPVGHVGGVGTSHEADEIGRNEGLDELGRVSPQLCAVAESGQVELHLTAGQLADREPDALRRRRLTRSAYVYPCIHITTSIISIQTAGIALGGTGLCSYRVRGVDGSCTKRLTVESYTVVVLLTFILIIISIPSPLTLSFQAQNIPFLQILPIVAFLSCSGLTTWIPHTVYCYF